MPCVMLGGIGAVGLTVYSNEKEAHEFETEQRGV